ncbi:glycosyltransferase family 2 protein [Paraburkholderia acidisoli]|uniref:Glycosyltransferase n=1 Tax=Paraburkholderia acidisoli TaxID=2571748 RepID=A0A7Z2GJP4_9BURK|nr:glycosyltransferase family A protein [Paraburkholderia acidisoli]QGZ62714.1 glycosyltransferase [Paraburkholderia acidisoli]
MQTTAPFLTVVIPTHKRPLLLERTLTSIKSQAQPFALEIIVIADEADAATDEVCQRLLGPQDIKIRRNGAPGPSASRNLGIDLAAGRYVMFLDDDDAWQPEFLARVAAVPPVQGGRFVYFDCNVVTENRAGERPEYISERRLDTAGRLNEMVFVQNQVHMSCLMFPRTVIGNTRFDVSMRAYEDWEFILAILSKEMPEHVALDCSTVYEVADASSDRRGDSGNATNAHAIMDYLYVYRRHPAPSDALRQQRAALMQRVGMGLPPELL